MRQVLVGCSMGDPAGVGPEVVLRACEELIDDTLPGILLLGDPDYLTARSEQLQLQLTLRQVADAEEARRRLGAGERGPWTYACATVEPGWQLGAPRSADARAALRCIDSGARLAASGALDALVTAPVNKRLIAFLEPSFRGHTEYLARQAEVRQPLMLFVGDRPHIALLTTHLPLRVAIAAVTRDRVVDCLGRLDADWSRWFGQRPRIALAGLNPHAGEQGLLGVEELQQLLPAISAARQRGVRARGPFPADSVVRHSEFDVVLALYHDQGTILAKRAPEPTVNMTLGLPYPRTSPDHGTAYDIAHRAIADHVPMRLAFELAARLAVRRLSDVDA